MIFNNKENLNSGFTLIELIVAIGLFAAVMTISIGAFLNVSDIQKKSEAMRNVSENISFSIEMMVRDIREGTGYGCNTVCDEFNFTDADNGSVAYKLEKDEDTGIGKIKRNDSTITSDDVNIEQLLFKLSGHGANNGQPFVTIYVGGVTDSKEKLKSSLNLQASVSQRKIDSEL